MIYQFHTNTDLFKFADAHDVYFTHCISANAAMGKGIAVEFVNRFPEVKALRSRPDLPLTIGKAYLTGRVFNLVTKPMHYHKPTLESLRKCIIDMRDNYYMSNQYLLPYNLCMPKIGCGLDKLNWSDVAKMLIEELRFIDIEVHVCDLSPGV